MLLAHVKSPVLSVAISLRMGWKFDAASANGQVSEVLSWHFDRSEAVGPGIQHR